MPACGYHRRCTQSRWDFVHQRFCAITSVRGFASSSRDCAKPHAVICKRQSADCRRDRKVDNIIYNNKLKFIMYTLSKQVFCAIFLLIFSPAAVSFSQIVYKPKWKR